MASSTETSPLKYRRLAGEIRRKISFGELKPGDQLPSLVEMREQGGLSRTTVERVHRMLESEGLVVREQGRGTFVTRPEAKVERGLIGCAVTGFQCSATIPYWAHLMEGVESEARASGRSVLLLPCDSVRDWDRVQGVIMVDEPSDPECQEMLVRLPHVTMVSRGDDNASVMADDFSGGQLAGRHLLGLGHRRIAVLSSHGPLARKRVAGWRDAMESAGVIPEPTWLRHIDENRFVGERFDVVAEETMAAWLAEDWAERGFTALVASNDKIAIGAIRAFQSAGLDVPSEVSVAGFDSTELCEFVAPRLTSVALPLVEVGTMAMRLLLRQLAGEPEMPGSVILPVRLDVRESTAPVRGA